MTSPQQNRPESAIPLLVIAPSRPRFEAWHRDRGIPSRLARLISDEWHLCGVSGGHVVIVDQRECACQLVSLVQHVAERYRLIVHRVTTADLPDLSGEELRARYGDQIEHVYPATPLLEILGRAGDADWAVAYRYGSMTALEAFAAGNRRHYGHETIGPVIGPDGLICGVTVVKPQLGSGS